MCHNKYPSSYVIYSSLVSNKQQVLIPFAEKLHEETIALRDEIDKNEVCISFLLLSLGCAIA
jgi:hypothetical protein